MEESDFAWIKDRIDDLQKKWKEDHDRTWRQFLALRETLEAIMNVEADDKANHIVVIRNLAASALENTDY